MILDTLGKWFGKRARYSTGIYWRAIHIRRDMDRVIIGRGHYLIVGPTGNPIQVDAVVVDLHLETPTTFWLLDLRPWKLTKMHFGGFEGTVVADRLKAIDVTPEKKKTWADIRPYRTKVYRLN